MGYQVLVEERLPAVTPSPGCSCCRIKIPLGLAGLEFGVVGTMLKGCPKPKPSHSLVTPTQPPALFRYSTRIHGPVMAAGVLGLLVSSSISGHVVQLFFSPLSV